MRKDVITGSSVWEARTAEGRRAKGRPGVGAATATPHVEARLESTVHLEGKAHTESRRHPNGAGPTAPAMPRPFAHGYYGGENGKGRIRDYTRINPTLAWTAGGMVSTLGDLTKWAKVLAKGTLLSRRLHAQQMRFGMIPTASGIPLGYGLGITRLGDWVGHNGAIYGFSTETFYDRSNGAEITAAANLSSNFSESTTDLFVKLADHLYPGSLRPR